MLKAARCPSGRSRSDWCDDAELDAVLNARGYEGEHDQAAINSLQTFINAVGAQRGNRIPEADTNAYDRFCPGDSRPVLRLGGWRAREITRQRSNRS